MSRTFSPLARAATAILLVTLLAGCRANAASGRPTSGAQTPALTLQQTVRAPAQRLTSTAVTSTLPDSAVPEAGNLEAITTENVMRLSLLARFAEGRLGDAFSLSPNGGLLAVAAEGGVMLYDAHTGARLDFYPTSSNVTALAFSPDSHTLAYFYRVPGGEKYGADDKDFAGQEILKPYLTLRSISSGRVLYSRPTFGNGCGEYAAWEITFSPDGQRILFHDYFGWPGKPRLGSLCVLDALDGSLLRAIQPENPWRVRGFTPLLPDGKTVWAVVVDDSRAVEAGVNLAQLRRYNLDTGALEAQLDVPNTLRAIRLSPDGQWMVGGTPAQIRSAADGSLAAVIPSSEESNPFSAASFSPDGRTLALGDWDGAVSLYSVPAGQPLSKLEPVTLTTILAKNEPLHAMDLGFSADGAVLYILSNSYFVDTPEVLRAVRLVDGQELFRLSGRNGVDRRPALSPDGTLLAWGGYEDGSAQVWSVENGKIRSFLKGHAQTILQTVFSPDGRQLATASLDGKVRLWNVADGTSIATLDAHDGGTWAVAYATDGSRLASIGMDGLLKLWDPADGHLLKTLESNTHGQQVNTLHFIAGDRTVLVVSGCIYPLNCAAQGAGGLESIDLESGQITSLLSDGILDLAFSADNLAFSSYSSNSAQWGQATSGQYQVQQTFISPYGNGALLGAAISPDGGLFLSGNGFGIHAWDTHSGQMIALAQEPGRTGNYGSMQISVDGRLLLVAGDDGVIYLWGVRRGP